VDAYRINRPNYKLGLQVSAAGDGNPIWKISSSSKAIGSFLSQKLAVFISMCDIFWAVETREEASWLTSHFDWATRHQSRRIKDANEWRMENEGKEPEVPPGRERLKSADSSQPVQSLFPIASGGRFRRAERAA
jgi:hypothetical protein